MTEKENLPHAAGAPARSAKPFDRKRKLPRATGARTSLKKKPALPLARAERKPLDQKRKHPPRYQRENQLKEKTALPLARAERRAI